MLPGNRTYGFWLAILRICVGLAWLAHGIPKFTASAAYLPPNGFMAKLVAGGVANGSGWYRDFLANVVTPHIGLFAELVRLGEVVTGCLLVLGVFTRLGGLGGMFLTANYMLADGTFGTNNLWSSIDGAMFMLSAANFVLPTGRVLGVDWLLGRVRAARKSSGKLPADAPQRAGTPWVAPSNAPIQPEFVEEQPLDGPTAPKE